MKTFVQDNWFKISLIALAVWLLTTPFHIEVCVKEAHVLPPIGGHSSCH